MLVVEDESLIRMNAVAMVEEAGFEDLVKISAPSGFKFISLFVRQLSAFVFDNEGSPLDRRCREKAQASAGSADTESSLAGHIAHVRRFAPGKQLGPRECTPSLLCGLNSAHRSRRSQKLVPERRRTVPPPSNPAMFRKPHPSAAVD